MDTRRFVIRWLRSLCMDRDKVRILIVKVT